MKAKEKTRKIQFLLIKCGSIGRAGIDKRLKDGRTVQILNISRFSATSAASQNSELECWTFEVGLQFASKGRSRGELKISQAESKISNLRIRIF